MKRTIVTLTGIDHVGIIAKICTFFAENNINILDINQSVTREFINMLIIVDTEMFEGSFDDLVAGLDKVGEDVGCTIKAQHEEIFNMMYRV